MPAFALAVVSVVGLAQLGQSFALPGARRVGWAGEMREGFALSALGGYGFTESAAGADSGHRLQASLAASLVPLSWFGAGLMFDGRFDARGGDGGWTGDPRLALRAGGKLSEAFSLAGQAIVWIPAGQDAPSLSFSATSVDLVALATHTGKKLTLGAQAGFRLNNSDRAFADAALLSNNDRASLMLSDSHAVLLGIGGSYALKKVELLAEATWDLHLGGPGALASPLRLDAGVRFGLDRARTIQLSILAEALLSSRPEASDGLSPIEPRVSLLAGITFALPSKRSAIDEPVAIEETPAPSPEAAPAPVQQPAVTTPPPPPAQMATTGGVRGEVRSTDGQAIAGAKISVGRPATVVRTAANGTFEVTELSPGDTSIVIEHENFTTRTITAIIKAGTNTDLSLTLDLKPAPGILRGMVEIFGRPAVARIEVEPGGHAIDSNERGEFKLELQPGEYSIKITAAGMHDYETKVQITSRGTATVHAELQKRRR